MKLLFLGDFFFDYEYEPNDLERISRFIEEQHCYVILNLESSLSKSGTPVEKRGPHLASSKFSIELMKKMRVIAVSLANNHMMDYGEKAFEETIQLLDQAGIVHFGAGRTLEEAMRPAKLELGEYEIIFQNFGWDVEETVYARENSCGCAPRNESLILEQTSRIRRENPKSIIVNCMHWGFEGNQLPMPIDVQLGHCMIDAGADLIIGHHPHVIQPFECWKGKEIFYSLGNFYFASRRADFDENCDFGAMVVFDLKSRATKKMLIKYHRTKDESVIEAYDETKFSDMTGVDWTGKNYMEKAIACKNNITPVLGLDEKENQKLIQKLYQKYWIAKKISFIKKCSLGQKLFSIAKKMMGKGH